MREARAEAKRVGRGRHALSLLWAILIVAFAVVFWRRQHGEVSRIDEVFRAARPFWLLVAAMLEPLMLITLAMLYRVLLRRLGYPRPILEILGAYLRGNAIGALMPLGGPASVAMFTRNLSREGVPAEMTFLAWLMSTVVGYASFLILLPVALVLLRAESALSDALLVAAAFIAGLFVVFAALLGYALHGARLPAGLLARLPPAARHALTARELGITPRDLLLPLALSLVLDLAASAILSACLLAVGAHTPLWAALVGQEVATVFATVAPLFQGLGAVELSLTVVLEEFGVSGAAALGATLLFRLFTFWLPLIVGLVISLARSVVARTRSLLDRYHGDLGARR